MVDFFIVEQVVKHNMESREKRIGFIREKFRRWQISLFLPQNQMNVIRAGFPSRIEVKMNSFHPIPSFTENIP